MLSWFKKVVVKTSDHNAEGRNATGTAAQAPVKIGHIYPPEDPGLPILTVETLVGSNESIISRLRLHAATDPGRYDARFHKPISRLAAHINTLPATSAGVFAGEGGLFRACVEMAFLCFQASDGRIFTGGATVEVRHKLEPRWRYVCFLAGLMYPIGKSLNRMVVTSSDGAPWPRHHKSITDWAEEKTLDRVYLSWPDDEHNLKDPVGPAAYTSSIVHQIAGPDNLDWLEQASPELTRALLEIVSGHPTDAKIAVEVINSMWAKVREREQMRRPQSYGRVTVGTHIAPYLTGAMKVLVQSGRWVPGNLPLIVDASGVYLVWPMAGEDLTSVEASGGRPGWPTSAAVIAELMKSAGAFDLSRGNDMGLTEVIDQNGEVHAAYLLKSPRTVIEDYDPKAYSKQSPKTLTAVLQKDPLARLEGTVAAAAPVAVVKAATPEAAPAVEGGEVVASATTGTSPARAATEVAPQPQKPEPSADDSSQAESVEPTTSGRRSKPKAVAPEGKLAEVADVKFADLVPEEVRREIKSPLNAEILGKVIKAWRDRGEGSDTMRVTEHGAAISYEYLTSLMRSVPDWLNDVGAAGLIYAPTATPGRKVQKVAIPEGKKPKDVVIIANYACRKLGL